MPTFGEGSGDEGAIASKGIQGQARRFIDKFMFDFSNGYSDGEEELWDAFTMLVLLNGTGILPTLQPPHSLTILSFLQKVLTKSLISVITGKITDRRQSYIEILSWVLACGLDPDTFVPMGHVIVTPLQLVACSGSQELVKLILEAGASPTGEAYLELPRCAELSPLEIALEPKAAARRLLYVGGQPIEPKDVQGVVRLLSEHGSLSGNPKRKAHQLRAAIRAGFMDVARSLVDEGASWDFELPSDATKRWAYKNCVGSETIFTAALRFNGEAWRSRARCSTSASKSVVCHRCHHTVQREGFSVGALSSADASDDDSTDLPQDVGKCNFACPRCGHDPNGAEEQSLDLLNIFLDILGYRPEASQTIGCWRPTDVAVIAASEGFNKVLGWLVDFGVDLESPNGQGITPWLAALKHRRRSTCDFLQRSGALAGSHGPVAIRATLCQGNNEILEDLLVANVDLRSAPNHILLAVALRLWRRLGARDDHECYVRRLYATSALAAAVKEGDCHACFLLMQAGAPMAGGILALAVERSDIKLAEVALAQGADVNEINALTGTPLQLAIGVGDLRLVCLLLANGANPQMKSSRWESCFEVALQGEDPELVDLARIYWCTEYDSVVLCAAVMWALRTWDDQYVRLMLSLRPPYRPTTGTEVNAIALAAHAMPSASAAAIFELLLAHIPASGGFCISKLDFKRFTSELAFHGYQRDTALEVMPSRLWRPHDIVSISPLSVALVPEACFVWQQLLEHGFCPDRFALLSAIHRNRSDIVRKFLDMGIQEGDQHQAILPSPVLVAVHNGSTEILRLLLQHGYDIDDRRDLDDETALQTACNAVNAVDNVMLAAVLDAKPDVSAKPRQYLGATALQYAAMHNNLDLAREILSRGSLEDINSHRAPNGGRTALEGAAEHGRLDMVEFLLSYGAKTTGSGQRQYLRAIKYAEKEGYLAVVKLLRDHRDWTRQDEERWNLDQELMTEDIWSDTGSDYPVSECSDENCEDKHFPSFWKQREPRLYDYSTSEDVPVTELTPPDQCTLEKRGQGGSAGAAPDDSRIHEGLEYFADSEHRDNDALAMPHHFQEGDWSSFLEFEDLMARDH